MEKKLIDHYFCHEHPLFLTENASDRETLGCYGCGNLVTNLEAAYVCMQQYCNSDIILHKRCGELPSQILHPQHPQHPLNLDYFGDSSAWCDLCSQDLNEVFGYQCLDGCDFVIDIACKKLNIGVLLEEKRELQHPSHPHHHLTLMRKHAFAFTCDGCGAQDVDMAYICSTCEFWIHKTCALLPPILPTNYQHHHHHQLSLAFSFPAEHRYAEFRYKCDVCNKDFDTTCWLYFCGDCRFFAHIKCVTTTTQSMKQDSNLDEDDYDGSSVIQFPLNAHHIIKELITPFVMREKGLNTIPNVKDMPSTINIPKTITSFSFLFNYHKHPLSLVSESSHENINKIMYGEEEDDDEDEDGESDDELKICDICVTPICSPPYYECIDCKYFVHSICYLLPKTLSSSSSSSFNSLLYGGCPKTHDKIHKFTLYTSSEWQDREHEMYRCTLCKFITNGMVYECEGCKVKIDVKCASLPSRIKHASHQHHKPLIMIRLSQEDRGRWKKCHGCEDDFDVGYCCSSDDCDFALDFTCAMLPQSIRKHEWDNHPLLLSFDASLDHPSYFVCEFCEEELHPKKWMYHCRQCDHSFHLFCPKIGSGWYKNIKFGRRFVLDGIHAHTLTIRCVTVRKWCSICCIEAYNYCGLECESCYYVVCLVCTAKIVKKIELAGDVSSSSDRVKDL